MLSTFSPIMQFTYGCHAQPAYRNCMIGGGDAR
jgi:hypothetical protein